MTFSPGYGTLRDMKAEAGSLGYRHLQSKGGGRYGIRGKTHPQAASQAGPHPGGAGPEAPRHPAGSLHLGDRTVPAGPHHPAIHRSGPGGGHSGADLRRAPAPGGAEAAAALDAAHGAFVRHGGGRGAPPLPSGRQRHLGHLALRVGLPVLEPELRRLPGGAARAVVPGTGPERPGEQPGEGPL